VSAAFTALEVGSTRGSVIARPDISLAPRPAPMLRRGEIVFHAGEPAVAAYFVESGWTALQRLSAAGRSFTLAWCGQGAVLGLAETLLGLSYQATAAMMTAGSVRRVSQLELRAQLRAGGRPAEAMMEALSRGWQEMAERLVTLGLADSAPQRLAHFVLEWAADGNPRPPLRHEEIAAQCGLARETVSRLVSDWRRQGIAAVRGGRAVVRDQARLQQIEAQGWHRTVPS
jgi:CRP-like cAMP-binding protein